MTNIFNIPAGTNDGDTHTVDGNTYVWNAAQMVWNLQISGSTAAITAVNSGDGTTAVTAGTVATVNVDVGEGVQLLSDAVVLALYSRKTDLFLGTEGTAGTVTLAGASRAFTPYTTNGVTYYFIDGVAISGGAFVVGDGVWTTLDPSTATVAQLLATNVSANLIG